MNRIVHLALKVEDLEAKTNPASRSARTKYLADHQVEQGYQNAADFAKSIGSIEKQSRPRLERAGVKLAR